MKKISLATILAAFFLVNGCASTPKATVLERADNMSEAPVWASTVTPFFERDGKYFYVGYVEVDGTSSKSAALNMSDEKALSEPLRSLTDQFLDQNQVGEELRKDSSVGQRVISATRGYRPPMPTLQIVNRYWETIRVPNANDTQLASLELRAFSLAQLSKSDFEDAKHAYFARLKGDSAVKKILDDVGAKQREQAVSH